MSKARTADAPVRSVRCAVYTRKSTDEGLEQEFNSLDAQREAAESFIASQRHEGWVVAPDRYDDGGYSGGTLDRPAMQKLLQSAAERLSLSQRACHRILRVARSIADLGDAAALRQQHIAEALNLRQPLQS